MKRIHLPESDKWLEVQLGKTEMKFNVFQRENSCFPVLRGEKRKNIPMLISSKTVGVDRDLIREVEDFLNNLHT